MTTTVLARDGKNLSEAVQADGWYSYLNEYDPADLIDDLADALLKAQQAEFNDRLPAGCSWHMSTSEVIGPVDAVIEDDLDDLMQQAVDAVAERFEEIETAVIEARENR